MSSQAERLPENAWGGNWDICKDSAMHIDICRASCSLTIYLVRLFFHLWPVLPFFFIFDMHIILSLCNLTWTDAEISTSCLFFNAHLKIQLQYTLPVTAALISSLRVTAVHIHFSSTLRSVPTTRTTLESFVRITFCEGIKKILDTGNCSGICVIKLELPPTLQALFLHISVTKTLGLLKKGTLQCKFVRSLHVLCFTDA